MKTVYTNIRVGLYMCLSLLIFSCEKSETIPNRIASVKVFPADSQAQNMGVIRLQDGTMILFGFSSDSGGYIGNQLMKCDHNGNQIWVKHLTKESEQVWICNAHPIGDHDFIVIGWSWSITQSDLFTARYDGNGKLIWKETITDSDLNLYPIASMIDREGNISIISRFGNKLLLARWNPNGGQILNQAISVEVPPNPNNTGDLDPYAMTEDKATGDFFIFSDFLYSGNSNASYYLTYNTMVHRISNKGEPRWLGYRRDSLNSQSIAGILYRDNVVHTFVNVGLNQAGLTPFFGDKTYGQIYHEQWDSSGAFLSSEALAGLPQNTYFNQVLPTSDGGFLLSGTTNLFSSGYTLNAKMMVAKLNSSFKTEWQKLVDTRSQSFGMQSFEADGAYFTSGSHVVGNKVQFQMVVKTQ